jgi:hypothetical protein
MPTDTLPLPAVATVTFTTAPLSPGGELLTSWHVVRGRERVGVGRVVTLHEGAVRAYYDAAGWLLGAEVLSEGAWAVEDYLPPGAGEQEGEAVHRHG